ncbi:MAG TPA: 8-oxo-dGTP diphosphatase MutT [Gemmatimonadales bacterium]|nr:8-oxo-dGTP diphosphatase MutT [Candidatus Bathyarchaeia archaeon]HUL01701.1 8-oxo-dGTP diphosphatase MutT [Gemmatimonadales bacterium]
MEVIDVVAAVVEREGRYLITRRLEGTHLAGLWEFPGGKIHPTERPEDALQRELREELAVEASVGRLLDTVTWIYPEKTVRIHFFECDVLGEPHPQESQEMRWVEAAALSSYAFPAADLTLVQRLSGAR